MPGVGGGGAGRGGAGPAEATPLASRQQRPPRGPRLARAARLLPGSAALGVRAGVRAGVLGSARGFLSGVGKSPGRRGPASPARSGRELSLRLLQSRRHWERLGDRRRRGLSRNAHSPQVS